VQVVCSLLMEETLGGDTREWGVRHGSGLKVVWTETGHDMACAIAEVERGQGENFMLPNPGCLSALE
jgi:hypothetical protein